MEQAEVIRYYDYTIPFYKLFWHKGTNALHYGFWGDGIQTHTEALINTNRVLADMVAIKSGDRVLDAGCGVGGSSIWLATQRGVDVTGITISPKQRDKAEKYARKAGVTHRTSFLTRDFLHTGFDTNSFDVVWAIESVCHARDKADFLREAFRVMKPGGRLVIADGFLRREIRPDEQGLYNDFLKGFALENLALATKFESDMNDIGFVNVRMTDKSAAIAPTAEFMRSMSLRWKRVHTIAGKLHLIPRLMLDNIQTGIIQKEFFEGPGIYAVFYGEKPPRNR